MDLPGLSFFHSPKKLVLSALEKPDYRTALILVLLPVIVAFAGNMIHSLSYDVLSFILSLVRNALVWLIISIVFYAGYILFAQGSLMYRFKEISSAFSLIWFGFLLVSLLGVVAFFFVSPAVGAVAVVSAEENLSMQQAFGLLDPIEKRDATALNSLMAENDISPKNTEALRTAFNSHSGELLNLIPLLLIGVVGILVFIFSTILLPYIIVRETFSWGPILNIILLLVLGFISLFLVGLLNFMLPSI